MSKQLAWQYRVYLAGGMGEQVGPQRRDPNWKTVQHQHADNHDIESVHAAMHQHLVDDDLGEQWRQETEQLQKKGGNNDFAKITPVMQDNR